MATDAQSITAPPADKQVILHNGKRYTTVKEGLAHILVPEPSEEEKKRSRDGQGVQQVFYNPIQQFNRDLTVLAIKAYGKEQIQQKKRKEQPDAERKTKAARLQNGADRNQTDDGAAPPAPAEPAEPEAELKAEEPVATEPAPESDQVINTEAKDGADEATQPPENPETSKREPPKFTILDALSASGLRALRYAHEISFVTQVTSNDLLQTAVETIKLNVQHNKLEEKITVSHDDALAHMYSVVVDDLRAQAQHQGKKPKVPIPSKKYDVVDLDPYGTAAPFLDAAVQAVRDDGGLLCVTCTDSGVWASNGYPEKCYSLYGGIPLKGWYSHEVGLRLILHAIETSAAKYGLAMEPLLSLSIDYYTRVFVKIRKSPARVKFQGGKTMITYNCDHGCGAWSTQYIMRNKAAVNKKGDGMFYKHGLAAGPTVDSTCEHCGSTMHVGGPMYGGRMHSPAFIKSILDELPEADTSIYGTTDRIRGMLQTALEEIMYTPEEIKAMEEAKTEPVDAKERKKREAAALEAELAAIDPYPFYFHSSHLAGSVHCAAPPERLLKGALRHMGYRVTRSHTKPGSMKTDAPWSVLWHVIREYERQKAPVKVENIKPGSVAYKLLRLGGRNKEPTDGATEPNGTNGVAPAKEPAEGEETAKGEEKMPEVVFDEALGRDVDQVKLVRYQTNPRENWGPMSRAKGR